MKTILYKIGKILSEGKGQQLLWLIALILIVLAALFVLLPDSFGDNDVLALFFGADSVTEGEGGVYVKLFVYILGTLLFSTFLISVITNIFDNFSNAFKGGRLEVNPRRHTLFLGASHLLIGMLREVAKEDMLKGPIVILTTSNIERLREKLFSTFSSKDYKKLRDKLVLIYGERDNKDSLEAVNAGFAQDIYLLGEDHEEFHDGKSIDCVSLLKEIKAGDFKVRCKVFLEDPYSVYSQIINNDHSFGQSLFCLDLFNIYDDIAEKVLSSNVPEIGLESRRYYHLVVSGHGQMSWAFVRTAFSMLHFPNFDEKTLKNRTTISIIDENAGRFMKEFMSLYANIFQLSHVRHEFSEGGERKVESYAPYEVFGDFLDTEWEFIEGDLRDPFIRARMEGWAQDETQFLSIALCDMDETVNIGSALSLPRKLYEVSVPVFAYLPSGSCILEGFGKDVFEKRIISFGKDSDSDVLFKDRAGRAMRTHYAYMAFHPETDQDNKIKRVIGDIDDEWYSLSESKKLSNYYSAASIPVKKRSFGFVSSIPLDQQLTEETLRLLDKVEHRRWIAAELLLGYYPIDKDIRHEESNKQFKHRLITPYAELSLSDKQKDSIMQLVNYIESNDIEQLIGKLEIEANKKEALGNHQRAENLRINKRQIISIYSSSNNKTSK